MLNGEDLGSLLMTVIKFCITSENHLLKKLLQVRVTWSCQTPVSPASQPPSLPPQSLTASLPPSLDTPLQGVS